MFHSFYIDAEHQHFLTLLWFKDNDPSKEVVENKVVVHLFGNGPTPAVAACGLWKTMNDGEEKYGVGAKQFVHRKLHVDDG